MELREGAIVRVRLAGGGGGWTAARVLIASQNGQSVALILDGPVRASGGAIMGMLPLLIDYDAETVTSVLGDEYEVEVL